MRLFVSELGKIGNKIVWFKEPLHESTDGLERAKAAICDAFSLTEGEICIYVKVGQPADLYPVESLAHLQNNDKVCFKIVDREEMLNV